MKRFSILLCWFLMPLAQHAQFIDSLNIAAKKLHYDQKRQVLYATVGESDPNYGNCIVVINPFTGTIFQQLPVGRNPTKIVGTSDGDYLYVAFDSLPAVKRVNLKTLTVDRVINLGSHNFFGPHFAEDLATFAFTNDLFVVARMYSNSSPRHAGVAAYYKGQLLPGTTPGHLGSNEIESINDSMVVGYDTESSEEGFRRMKVDTVSGVTLLSKDTHMDLGATIKYCNGLVYSGSGRILDAIASPPSIVGTCSITSYYYYSYQTEPDPTVARVYFATVSGGLRVSYFNMYTTSFMADYTINNVFPASFQAVNDLEHFDGHGLAAVVSEHYLGRGKSKLILTHFGMTVGEDDQDADGLMIEIYPNPAYSNFTISKIREKEITITDQLGRIIFRQGPSAMDQLTLDPAHAGLAPGVYTVRMQQHGKIPLSRKLILEQH